VQSWAQMFLQHWATSFGGKHNVQKHLTD
jgi:hypothetical protein